MPRNHIRICFETIVRIHSRFKTGDAFLCEFVSPQELTNMQDVHPLSQACFCLMGGSTATSLEMLRNKSQHC